MNRTFQVVLSASIVLGVSAAPAVAAEPGFAAPTTVAMLNAVSGRIMHRAVTVHVPAHQGNTPAPPVAPGTGHAATESAGGLGGVGKGDPIPGGRGRQSAVREGAAEPATHD